MGYAHSWNRPHTIASNTFQAIATDLLSLLPCMEAAGVPPANLYGLELPEIGPKSIEFNGIQHCGHTANPKVCIPWPSAQACGVSNNEAAGSTLPYRTCNGDCSYESFWFPRELPSEPAPGDGMHYGFCKTAFRPYDLAVNVALVIAKHHMSGNLTVQTDGEQPQWVEAFAMAQAQLGYGAEYSIAADRHMRSLQA